MINEVSINDFASVYERMEEGFPPEEMKSLEDFLCLLKKGDYSCLGFYPNEGNLAGVALGHSCSRKLFWLDYLLIYEEHRNKGFGKGFLQELLSSFGFRGIFLEVEKSQSDDYHDVTNRRLRFYESLNVQLIPCPYRFPCSDGNIIDSLSLMLLPGLGLTHLSKEEIQSFVKESITTIHGGLPHYRLALDFYIDKIHDLDVERFSLNKVNLTDLDEVRKVGELIYHTDPYVYPAFFDNDIELARKCALKLLEKETLFHHKNIKIGKINGRIAGFMVILDEFPKDNYHQMKEAMEESLGHLTPRFEECMEGYFNTLSEGWEGRQIMSLAVLPEYRKKRVASKMLNSLPKTDTFSLACVKANQPARDLYRKCGYEYRFEYPGFTAIPCVELVKKGKQ